MNLSAVKNSKGEIKDWCEFAAGTVSCVYPSPVFADSLAELAIIESKAMELGFDKVKTHVCCYFESGYMGNEVTMHGVSLKDFSGEFDTCNRGAENFLDCKHKSQYVMNFTRKYSYDSVYLAKADSLVDLYLKMVRDGVRGTFVVSFMAHYRGNETETKTLRIVI